MRSAEVSAKFTYRPEIDGLRALAVLAVIVYHFNKDFLTSGYLGVDIFFVISGYVITSSLYGSLNKSFTDFLLDFYSRRMKRLAPALLLCVIAGSVLICLFNIKPEESLSTGIRALFGFSNIYLYQASTNYFATSTELNVFTHTWSLGVEEQFYLLYPLLLWMLGANRLTAGNIRRQGMFIGALSACSLLTFIFLSRVDKAAAFFLVFARFWELGIGCLVFFLLNETAFKRFVARLPSFLVFAFLIVTLYAPLHLEVHATVTVVLLTALIIGCINNNNIVHLIFSQPFIVRIGVLSYSLYLWHWIVIAISRWTVGIHWWSVPFQLALIYILAVFSYRYVEKPLRSMEWSSYRRLSIAYGMAGSIIVAGVLIIFAKPLGSNLYLGDRKSFRKPASAVLAPYSSALVEVKDLRRKGNMTPHHLSGTAYRPKPTVDRQFIRNSIQSATSSKKILLVGDSFAQAISNHLYLIADKLGYEFKMIFGYGCPYPFPLSEIESRASLQCKEVDEKILQQEIIDALHEDDVLVIRLFFQKPQYLNYHKEKLPEVATYDSTMLKLINAVKSKKAKLFIIGSNPTLTATQFQSITPQWFNLYSELSQGYTVKLDTPENAYFHLIDKHFQKFFSDIDGASYFSLEPYLCNAMNTCKTTDNGKLLYSDEHHLTPYAIDMFYDSLFKQILSVVNDR